jgi:EpsI family protein
MHASAHALRNAFLSAGLILAVALVYWPSSNALWGYWTDPNYGGSHGLLVVALAAWLWFRERHELARVPVRPSLASGVLLTLSTIAWFVFYRAGIQTLHILLLPVLMGLAIATALGFRAALLLAFPLAFLYFATPAWGVCVGPLQSLTTAAVGIIAPLIAIPAQMHGNLVVLPGIGLLGEMEKASLRRRALLLTVMAVLAIVSNWIRVLLIIDAGYTTQMRHVLVSRGHLMFGWFLFTAVVVIFTWFFARPPANSPSMRRDTLPLDSSPVGYVGTILAIVAVPVLVHTFVAGRDASVLPIAFSAPAGKGGWQGPLQPTAVAWRPDFVGPHSQWYFAYEDGSGDNVELVAIGYPLQGQGRELVNEENSLFGSGSNSEAQSKIDLDGTYYVEFLVVDDKGQRSLVWSIYDIGGREFVTPLFSQLWYGVRSLMGPPYSVQFAFRTPCKTSCNSARGTLQRFLRAMGPECFASVRSALRPGSS